MTRRGGNGVGGKEGSGVRGKGEGQEEHSGK